MKLSLVIPVYGSAAILEESYRFLTETVGAAITDYEILFRNDCSPDGSQEVLENLAQKDPHVRVFCNERNRGLGYTLRHLFSDARGEYLIYLDADAYRCFDFTALPQFLEDICKYDVIVASRYETNKEHIPLHRVWASRLYSQLTKLLFELQVEDVGSGFVLFRKSVLDKITLNADGFDIHIEVFAKIQKAGYKIKETPVNYRHWYGGSFAVFKHGLSTLMGTLRVWWALNKISSGRSSIL